MFEHLVSLGVKPNAKSYTLLVDAHLINRDVKSALAVIDDMVSAWFCFKNLCTEYIYFLQRSLTCQIYLQTAAGFEPSKVTLKKVRRRCIRESDYESDQRVESLARSLNIRLGSEVRRNMLFNLDYSMDMA